MKNQREQVGFREIPVIVASFFRSADPSFAFRCIPQKSLLLNFLATLEQRALTTEFKLQRALDTGKRIHVLHFGLCAELFLAKRTRTDVCVNAQASFLHAHVADAEVLKDLPE